MSRSELRRVPEQRMLGSSDVLDKGLVFQHELRRVPEPSIGLVPHPVRIGSAALLGARTNWKESLLFKLESEERFYWK